MKVNVRRLSGCELEAYNYRAEAARCLEKAFNANTREAQARLGAKWQGHCSTDMLLQVDYMMHEHPELWGSNPPTLQIF